MIKQIERKYLFCSLCSYQMLGILWLEGYNVMLRCNHCGSFSHIHMTYTKQKDQPKLKSVKKGNRYVG